MKYNNLKIAYFFFFSYLASHQVVYGTINIFIHTYPDQNKTVTQKLEQQLDIPGKMSEKIIKNLYLSRNAHEGIFSTYWGYLARSGFDGQLSFPRKQQKAEFNLLITPEIKPIIMIGNTIHHLEIDRSVPNELYTITQRKDPNTKALFWETKKGSLPQNNIITLNTIVLFAKPTNIYVPLGITLTTNNPQLVLPDIYAKKEINIPARALWVLLVRQFFGPLNKIIKKETPLYFSENLNIK